MHLSQLYIHPLKSGAAISVNAITYSKTGPEHDREWMVVDSDGVFISQRSVPKLCLIKASVLASGDLELSVPSIAHYPSIIAYYTQSVTRVSIWQDSPLAMDCGDHASQWLTDFLGVSCRLVKTFNKTNRPVDTDYAKQGQTMGFADGFPTLIAGKASLDGFNAELARLNSNTVNEENNTHHYTPVDMRRFRPNIVIDTPLPFAEDTWRRIRINTIEFNLVKPCSRCIMPSINPNTGRKELLVNQTLLKTRMRDKQTFFGQNALHNGEGIIRVGDAVEVIETC